MIRRLRYFLAALVLMATLAACTTTPTKTSLWEVNSAQRTVYIASDTLALSPTDYPLPAPFTKAFAASSELLVEHNPDTSKKHYAKAHALVMKQGMFPQDKTLEDVLTPTQLAAVKAGVTENGTPFAHLKRLRPWMLAFVWHKAEPEPAPHSRHATKQPTSLTTYFQKQAQARSIPIRPLESDAKFFDLASSLPMKAQINHLVHVIKTEHGPKTQASNMRELDKAWRTGDTATVMARSGGFKGQPKYRQTMVVDRNETWAHALESKLRTRGAPIFVVVGDAHVMGQDNMLALLRTDGFHVRQL